MTRVKALDNKSVERVSTGQRRLIFNRRTLTVTELAMGLW